MRPAVDAGDLLRDPIGSYFIGPTFVFWCRTPSLFGATVWGTSTPEHSRQLMALVDVIRHPAMARRLHVFVDSRAVERIEATSLLLAAKWAHERMAEFRERIRRHVIVISPGVPGIEHAGLFPSVGPSHQHRVVLDPGLAFDYLWDQAEAAEAHAEIERVVLAAQGGTSALQRLRTLLRSDPVAPTLGSSAIALGLSPRSLQRQLRAQQTSFSAELRRARVSCASEALAEDGAKIGAVALLAGFSSAARMTAAFRRELGLTPSEVRAMRGPAGGTKPLRMRGI